MLAVPLSEAAVRPYLRDGVELAVVHGHELTVLAGSDAEATKLEARLSADRVICRRVRNTHAVHTRAMTPIVGPLETLFRRFTLRPPEIPFVSNASGTWVTEAEATSPRYWARHVAQPVRFADGMGALWRKPGRVILEVGPGRTSCVVAMQHPMCERIERPLALPTLRHAYEQGTDDSRYLLTTVGRLWLAGLEPDWLEFYRQERRHRVPMPTYPFERTRYCIEPSRAVAAPTSSSSAAAHVATRPTVGEQPVTRSVGYHARPKLTSDYVRRRARWSARSRGSGARC